MATWLCGGFQASLIRERIVAFFAVRLSGCENVTLTPHRSARTYKASLLQEALQPLPLTPECAPVAPLERLVGPRQCLTCLACGRLWRLSGSFWCQRSLAEYGLESLSQSRFHR